MRIKVPPFFLLIFLLQTGFSQKDTIGWILGGSLSLQNDHQRSESMDPFKDNTYSFNLIRFSPYFGKILNERWILGLSIDFETHWSRSERVEDNFLYSKNFDYRLGLSLFTRYRLNPHHKLGYSLVSSLGYSHSWGKYKQEDLIVSQFSIKRINLNTGIQLSYPISNRLSVLSTLVRLDMDQRFFDEDASGIDIRFSLLRIATLAFEYRF